MKVTRRIAAALLSPLSLILLCGVALPTGILFVYSFYRYDFYQLTPAFQFDSYTTIFHQSFYAQVAWNTLAIALPTTVITIVGGYAIAYYLAVVAHRFRTLGLALVIFSLLASYLARVYAWRTLMGSDGVINSTLETLGLITHPLNWLLFSRVAVIAAEVNLYLPVATLILYAALVGIADGLREAARDLGAGRFETLRRVTLPLTGRALFGAAALAFFLSCGDYITPEFLGGPTTSQTFGTVIATQITMNADYPLGAAMSFAMSAGFIIYAFLLWLGLRTARLLPRHA